MEQKSFGLLLEDVIGNSHVNCLIDDQMNEMIVYHQKFLVVKGSLLTVMSQTEARIITGDNKLRHNYKFVSDHHTITLHCKPSQVFPITKNQRALLSGVPRESDRIEVLHNLDWVEKLHDLSFVYVTIPTIPTPVRGIVCHVGPVEGEAGTKFGIELQERRGEGTSDGTFKGVDYFECDPDCGVFVSMDKLTQKKSFEATKVVHAKEESPQAEDDRPFKVDDRVRIFNKSGIAFKGIVRSIKKDVLGIETENSLTHKSFPGYVEDSKRRADFTIIKRHHSKLFLPAHLVKRDHFHETTGHLQKKEAARQKRLQEENKLPEEATLKQKEETARQKRMQGEAAQQDTHSKQGYQPMWPSPDPHPSKPDPQSSNDNPCELEVGSMIQFGNPPCYGVIKWMGILPETEHVLMAGVELDSPVEGYTKYDDGWHGGKRLFMSQINRGLFLPMKGLFPDERFLCDHTKDLPNHESGNLRVNTVILHQDSTTSDTETKHSKNRDDELNIISVTVNQLHQNVEKMEEKFCAVEKHMKGYIYKTEKTEESVQRIEVNVENAFKKSINVQKSNEELQASSVDVKNQLLDIQKDKEHLQNQMSLILDKLSHAQQQMSDMQKSNEKLLTTCEQLQVTNVQLQNQLSLTQQQLLGVQSMMTCSRLWVVSHDQFTIRREIGRGAWATVHEATFRGATVAAKRLHDEITSPATIELFHQEMQMALHCQHQNIVTFLGVTLEDHPVILMELMDVNLRSAYKRGNVQYPQVFGIFFDVAKALHFLHTRPDPVIHRDVSSANVLLKAQYNGEWLAKLGDLGTAKIQQQIATPGPGALAYAAPEVGDPKCHSTKMDVYSFGVLVVEILTKTLPFQTLNALKVQVQQQFPQYHHLVTSCTNQQSSDRLTMYDVIMQLNKTTATVA